MLTRILFFITALQILNLSIDVDSIFMQDHTVVHTSFDDVDSYSELLVEFLADDEDLISEDDNDDGNPDHGNSLKYHPIPLFSDGHDLFRLPANPSGSLLTHHIRNSSLISTGYTNIILPPPDFS